MWSLSVEEQFYIAVPLIALLGRRFGLRIVSLTLIAVSYVTVIGYAWKGWHGFSSQWTNSLVQFQFFAAGTLLSLALKGRTPQWSLTRRLLGLSTGIVCLFVASVYLGVQADTPHSTVLQAPLGWALVLAGTTLFFLSPTQRVSARDRVDRSSWNHHCLLCHRHARAPVLSVL